jgi:hypothetical protein
MFESLDFLYVPAPSVSGFSHHSHYAKDYKSSLGKSGFTNESLVTNHEDLCFQIVEY